MRKQQRDFFLILAFLTHWALPLGPVFFIVSDISKTAMVGRHPQAVQCLVFSCKVHHCAMDANGIGIPGQKVRCAKCARQNNSLMLEKMRVHHPQQGSTKAAKMASMVVWQSAIKSLGSSYRPLVYVPSIHGAAGSTHAGSWPHCETAW